MKQYDNFVFPSSDSATTEIFSGGLPDSEQLDSIVSTQFVQYIKYKNVITGNNASPTIGTVVKYK